ncbi:I-TevIII-like protein [Serratia phage X20]|uniref:I-TevIII-like protein n=1 Tax=Serratia phage X20 TaxID=2006942 RepID=A0A1Z1LZD6_9CAUD|nr:intron-like DNA endonuclease [Serratia phage X20]ARW58152.1 I-TevIII-like protein [Serratia phage X20]
MNEYGNHRKIWIESNGEIPLDEFGRSYHIHHIDGNPSNNELSNLLCLSPNDHFELHRSQGDYGAAFLLLNNHLSISPEERSDIISKSNSARWINYSEKERETIINKNRDSNISTWSSEKLRSDTGYKVKQNHLAKTKEQKEKESKLKSFSIKAAWKSNSFNAQREHMSTKVVCPHCGKEGQKAAMSRYHFDRCKYGRAITN